MRVFIIFFSILTSYHFAFANTPLIACATAHGNLSHGLNKTDSGYQAIIALPKRRNSQGEWVPNIPLSNDNLFSDRIEFLVKKTEVFSQIFSEINYLEILFEEDECANIQTEKHAIWFCASSKARDFNGIEIQSLEFSIENQTRANVVENGINAFYADLSIRLPPNSSGASYIYKTPYTYYPDGENTFCNF